MTDEPDTAVREIDTDLGPEDQPRDIRPMPGGDRLKIVGLFVCIAAVAGVFGIGGLVVLQEANANRPAPADEFERLAESGSQLAPVEQAPRWNVPPELPSPLANETEPTRTPVAMQTQPTGPATRPLPSAAELEWERRSFQVQRDLDELNRTIKQLNKTAGQWEATTSNLEQDERGRRLASDPDLLQQYLALLEQPRPAFTRVIKLCIDVEVLTEEMENAQADPHSLAKAEAQIPVLKEEADAAQKIYGEHQDLLSRLVLTAASYPEASESLAEARERLQAAETAERLQQMAAARDQAKAENTRQLAAAEAEREREAGRLKQLEVEQQAAALREKQAELARAAEREKLRKEALQPGVLAVLKPVTEPDVTQIRDVTRGGLALWERIPKPKPLSLAALQSLGALEQNEDGMVILAILNSRKGTSRPRWNLQYAATEPTLWSRQQHEMIANMQDYLIRYGEILVEEGLLAP